MNAELPARSILVVDDESSVRQLLANYLAAKGHHVRMAADGYDALVQVQDNPPDMVILDLQMPGLDGVSVIQRLKDLRYSGAMIALSGVPDEDRLRQMLELGAVDVLPKPVDLERLALEIEIGCRLSGK
jgi:DNA-binding response OmpR family regulator